MTEKCTIAQLKAYFEEGGHRKVSMQELKDLKTDPKSYDAIAYGIGDGSLTY